MNEGSLGSAHAPALLQVLVVVVVIQEAWIGCGTDSYIGHSLRLLPSLEKLKQTPCGST